MARKSRQFRYITNQIILRMLQDYILTKMSDASGNKKALIAGTKNPDAEGTCKYSSATTWFAEVRLHIGARKNIPR